MALFIDRRSIDALATNVYEVSILRGQEINYVGFFVKEVSIDLTVKPLIQDLLPESEVLNIETFIEFYDVGYVSDQALKVTIAEKGNVANKYLLVIGTGKDRRLSSGISGSAFAQRVRGGGL